MTPQEAHEELADELTGLIRDVVMLHRPNANGWCEGCDWGLWPEGGPSWPCSTIRLVREGMGL